MDLPKIRIGSVEVSRLVIGGNPFSAISHQTREADKEMRDYYTAAKIKETWAECERLGINSFLGRVDNHICRLLHEYWNEGGKIQFFGQTAPERADMDTNIRQAAFYGATGCYLQGNQVRGYYEEGRLGELADKLKLIRDLGMLAGMAEHNPKVLLEAQEMGLDVDYYMVCFYDIPGRKGKILEGGSPEVYVSEDRDAAVRAIRELRKPCFGYKIMAAGRNDPNEAFRFAFKHIKPADAVVVGMYTRRRPDQVEQNVRLALEAIQAR